MYGEKLTRFERFMLRFAPEPIEVVKAELKQAQLAQLQSISQAEYADLRMQMHKLTADYHGNRADRMKQFIADVEYDPNTVAEPTPGG